ncbi:MAG: DUF4350 domain-containing protein [Chitinispirillaceae bacterium]
MSGEKKQNKSFLKRIRADKTALFIKEHKLFTFFFLLLCIVNISLILKEKPKVDSYSCSTHDRGPYGTSVLFEYLSNKKLKVSRMELPSYTQLKKGTSGKTLVILSPQFTPAAWEWEHILSWVAQGNRLITSGFTGPRSSMFDEQKSIYTFAAREELDSIKVLLPAPENTPEALKPDHQIGISFFDKTKTEPGDTVLLNHLSTTYFKADMVPFLSLKDKVIAAKRAVGKGEWIMFTQPNPLSNTLLKHPSWYKFAVSLIVGNSSFSKREIIFDEYHNGFRATESLWELLRFYKFDRGIIFLCCMGILFLFFTGIRTAPPTVLGYRHVKDVIPGLKAMGNLVCRHKAYNGLLKRELDLIKYEAAGRINKKLSVEELYGLYTRKGKLPRGMTREEFERLIVEAYSGKNTEPETTIRILNLFVHMRKELRL